VADGAYVADGIGVLAVDDPVGHGDPVGEQDPATVCPAMGRV